LTSSDRTYLRGVRVLELANELGEYTGKILAGLGADVVKVEPPEGEETRRYAPFYEDEPGLERSLYFWHFNLGKRSVRLDLDDEQARRSFASLAAVADVVVDARPGSYLADRGVGYEALRVRNPSLVYLRITPFGEEGPWAGFHGSDLVHLALGGMMSNSGYDPDPTGFYETPPIAPQMWLAYQTAGELAVMSVLAALHHRLATGHGQYLSSSIHQANAANTELDIPSWVGLRVPVVRQTGRHARATLTARAIAPTKDGRYISPYATYTRRFPTTWPLDIALLRKYGMQEDLDDPRWEDDAYRTDNQGHVADVMDRLIRRMTYDSGLWQEMLEAGATWAPVRRPEENLDDPHWHARHTFTEVEHPEIGRAFTYVGARWVSDEASWSVDRRAPLLGEHDDVVAADWGARPTGHRAVYARPSTGAAIRSKHGRPFPLSGVRVLDLSWMLASAGGGRFLASMGAEVIKVEHESRFDGMRFTGISYPAGGRAERDAATAPIPAPPHASVNSSVSFNEINCGKLGISLDLKDPRGKAILEDLIRSSDVVIEGYSPGTMTRMGLGYEVLRELNPAIVYLHQSGLGERGGYARAKTFGPTAQAFSGLTDMSGLPEPWPPAGIGYSYLDWFGAYNVATAVLAALYRRDLTGDGCFIDASQVEIGIHLAGVAILDSSANGRRWRRHGNRSPYKPAAPHGAYRAAGTDRWIAIGNFSEEQWNRTIEVLGAPGWARNPRFATLELRLQHQDELDSLMNEETVKWDRWDLMHALQAAGVPAGVTQDAGDRLDHDPQLKALGWLVEVAHTEHGCWPMREHPVRFSETPTYAGGIADRAGPLYGEDTDSVLSRILGLTPEEIEALRAEGVI
jgi:crotonobetainyl-CoA:carnitine CoA-transferase CaiB-like acyl-CoA transferase